MSSVNSNFGSNWALARTAILMVVVAAMAGMPLNCLAQIKVALTSTADPQRSGSFVWANAFAEELQKQGMEVIIYPSSTLGNEIVRTEQILLGLLEVNLTGSQEVEMFSELYRGLELPFLFQSPEELLALIAETSFLARVNATTRPSGMRVVDVAPLGGMTGLFTTKLPVHQLDDITSLRLRAMNSQQLDFFLAWGGAGTQVAWEEVPQALQTGITDGYLNPPIVAVQFGHGGQLDYFTDLRVQPSSRTVVMSELWYQGLEEDKQHAVDHAVRQAGKAARTWNIATQLSEFQMLQDIGIEVIALSARERERFKERLLPLYETVSAQVLQEIMNMVNTVREDQ
jgi:TRAP-type C4-dicarboxylate transport system substrate-binding protein